MARFRSPAVTWATSTKAGRTVALWHDFREAFLLTVLSCILKLPVMCPHGFCTQSLLVFKKQTMNTRSFILGKINTAGPEPRDEVGLGRAQGHNPPWGWPST